jgi:hypothetical protein
VRKMIDLVCRMLMAQRLVFGRYCYREMQMVMKTKM